MGAGHSGRVHPSGAGGEHVGPGRALCGSATLLQGPAQLLRAPTQPALRTGGGTTGGGQRHGLLQKGCPGLSSSHGRALYVHTWMVVYCFTCV